ACSGGNSGGSSKQPSEAPKPSASQSTGTSEPSAAPEAPLEVSIMVPAFSTELPDSSSPVIKELEAYTNTKIEMQFVPNSSYPDKMNITLASGQLPDIIQADRNAASFINAARAGAFWELGPYLK